MHSIGTMISTYRKKKGLSQQQLSELLHTQFGCSISNKSISKWERDLTSPDIHLFFNLCRLLEIPDLYEAYLGYNPWSPLSPLNEAGREKAEEYIRLLCLDARYREQTEPPVHPAFSADQAAPSRRTSRTIPLQLYPVSAGPGNFLDDENYEDIPAGEEVPAGADFAVRVSGDSMEPLLHKNQIIYVHRQETLENGEYGIFFLDGEAYVKRFQKDKAGTFLVSLNKKYAPLPVTEGSDFRIFGRLVF